MSEVGELQRRVGARVRARRLQRDGTLPPHSIHFITEKDGIELTLDIEEISGQVTVREGYVEFYSPEEEDFDNLSGGEDDG